MLTARTGATRAGVASSSPAQTREVVPAGACYTAAPGPEESCQLVPAAQLRPVQREACHASCTVVPRSLKFLLL